MPKPRKLLMDERFALSNDDLKTKSRPAACARSRHSRAIINACSGDSTTQGPAMIVSRPSPNVALPTEKDLAIGSRHKRHTEHKMITSSAVSTQIRYVLFVPFCGLPSIRLTLSRNELGWGG